MGPMISGPRGGTDNAETGLKTADESPSWRGYNARRTHAAADINTLYSSYRSSPAERCPYESIRACLVAPTVTNMTFTPRRQPMARNLRFSSFVYPPLIFLFLTFSLLLFLNVCLNFWVSFFPSHFIFCFHFGVLVVHLRPEGWFQSTMTRVIKTARMTHHS